MVDVIETSAPSTIVELADKSTIVTVVETVNLIKEKVELNIVEMSNSPTNVVHEATVIRVGESSGGANSFFPSGW